MTKTELHDKWQTIFYEVHTLFDGVCLAWVLFFLTVYLLTVDDFEDFWWAVNFHLSVSTSCNPVARSHHQFNISISRIVVDDIHGVHCGLPNIHCLSQILFTISFIWKKSSKRINIYYEDRGQRGTKSVNQSNYKKDWKCFRKYFKRIKCFKMFKCFKDRNVLKGLNVLKGSNILNGLNVLKGLDNSKVLNVLKGLNVFSVWTVKIF